MAKRKDMESTAQRNMGRTPVIALGIPFDDAYSGKDSILILEDGTRLPRGNPFNSLNIGVDFSTEPSSINVLCPSLPACVTYDMQSRRELGELFFAEATTIEIERCKQDPEHFKDVCKRIHNDCVIKVPLTDELKRLGLPSSKKHDLKLKGYMTEDNRIVVESASVLRRNPLHYPPGTDPNDLPDDTSSQMTDMPGRDCRPKAETI